MSLFKTVSMTRRRYILGTYINGKYAEGTATDTPFKGTAQPVSGDEMELLPEARRGSEAMWVISDPTFDIRTAKENSHNADWISIDGDWFEVLEARRWKNSIIPHYRALVVRI